MLLVAAGLVVLASSTTLFVLDRDLYLRFMGLWWTRTDAIPFIDAVTGAQVGCWQRGIDVYVTDPCDPLGRVFDYSPLWLRLWFLPSDLKWTNALGLSQAVILILCLGVLPVTRRRADAVPMLLATLSPAAVFGVERSNVDLFMFVLATCGVICLQFRLPGRIAGYAAMFLGGLLKFYPLVLLLLLVRERTRTFLALSAGFGVILVGLVLAFRGELARSLANTPAPSPFEYSFGAHQLPAGLGLISGSPTLAAILLAALLAGCGATALRLARQPGFAAALSGLTQRETLCLLVGADLTCGCFFGADNAGYRAIFLLFALPALLAMPRLFRSAAWVAIAAMWIRIPMAMTGPEPVAFQGGNPSLFFVLWLCREVLWWGLVSVLLGVLIRMVLASPTWRTAFPAP